MTNTVLKFLAASAMVASVSGAALADSADYSFDGISPKVLKVVGDGTQYTGLKSTNGNVEFDFRIQYDTETSGKIKRWEAAIIDHGVHWSGFNWGFYDRFQGYAQGNRPNDININSSVSIPKSSLEATAVQICNLTAAALKQNGASDFEIYGKSRTIKSDFTMAFDVDATGAGAGNVVVESQGEGGTHSLSVTCERKRGVVKPGLVGGNSGGIQSSSETGIRTASLAVEPVTNKGGGCKARLYLNIQTYEPNINVNFRFHHNSGAKSSVFNKKSAGNGKFQFVKEFDVTTNQQGYAIGNFQAKNAGGSKWETNKVSYNFKCANAPIGGINSGQGTQPNRIKIN